MVGPSSRLGMRSPGTGSTVSARCKVRTSLHWTTLVRAITAIYIILTVTEATTTDTIYQDESFHPRTVDQCFGQTIPIQCDPGYMVQVNKVFYRQARHCHGSFHSNFCTREEPSNPACVGNETCIFTTPYIYLSPECGYSNNFLVTYKCIPASLPTDICEEGTLSAPSGYIVSPHYPAKYPPSKNCKVTILADKGSIIKVYLLDLFLAYYNYDVTRQCVDNLWMVGEGEWDRTSYLCSGQQRGLVFTSESNQVTVYFTSKSQEFLNAKGFWLYYEVVKPPEEGSRDSTIIPTNVYKSTLPIRTIPPLTVTPQHTTTHPVTTSIQTTTNLPKTTTTTATTTSPTSTTTKPTTTTSQSTTTVSTTVNGRTTSMAPQVVTSVAPSTTMDPPQVIHFRDKPVASDDDIDLTEYLQSPETGGLEEKMKIKTTTTPPPPTTTIIKEHQSLFVEDFNDTLVSDNKVVSEKTDEQENVEVGIVEKLAESTTAKQVNALFTFGETKEEAVNGLGGVMEEGMVGLPDATSVTHGNGSRDGNLTVFLEMYNESVDKERPKVPLWAKETPSQAAVFFRQMNDTTRKSIVGGVAGCLFLVLAITVLAILIKRRRSAKNIAPPLQPCVQPKNFDDIILAYGSNDSTKGFVNVGFENESVQDFSIDSTSQSDSSCTWSGTMNSWRGLNPIDEGPEIVYMDAKTAASRKSSGCSKKVKWVKSKSLDDIRHTIRLTQRQLASRSGYTKKKDQDREPFTSMGSLDEDTDGSELSTASTTKLTLATSKQYNTLNDLASCLAQSETTLYSNASTTDSSHQITFSGEQNRAESYSPYETVHFQHQEEVAL